jgi:hypothetical protein
MNEKVICVRWIRRDSAICTPTTSKRKCRAYLIGSTSQKPEKPNSKTARDSLALYCSYFDKERGIRTVVDGYFIDER